MHIGDMQVAGVTLAFDSASGCYRLAAQVADGSVTVELRFPPTLLQSLVLQSVALMPAVLPTVEVASEAEAVRLPARVLLHLDDRSMQALLREVSMDILNDFLWYMQDEALVVRVTDNLSQRAAAHLVEEMNGSWRGQCAPDAALTSYTLRGREAVRQVLALCERLVGEGSMADCFVHLRPAGGE